VMFSFSSIRDGIKFGYSDGREMALPSIRRDFIQTLLLSKLLA